MSKRLTNEQWRVIVNAICTILTTVIAGITMTSCVILP